MNNKHSNYSEDRFGRDKNMDNSNNINTSKSNSNILEDICEICHRYTTNIYTHIKEFHPIIYRKMTFRE